MPTFNEIVKFIQTLYNGKCLNFSDDSKILQISSINDANHPQTLTWVNSTEKLQEKPFTAGLVIAPKHAFYYEKTICVDNPKYVLAMVLKKFFTNLAENKHAIAKKSFRIGDNSSIVNTYMGTNCHIGANCSIGYPGINIARDNNNNFTDFLHIGTVEIGDHVKIGNNVCIQRAIFGKTRILHYSTIGSLVNIGHNCEIGREVVIINGAIICGSVKIGDGSCIGAGAIIRNKVKIGKNVTVGAGSVVLKDIPDNKKVIGNPARIIKSTKEYPPK